MHFYQHHIGDFNNATRHLSIVERAIYRDLLDMYYEQESAIDATDLNKLERRLLIRSTDEKQALEFVLDEFFEKQDDFYFNNRCESEIKQYQDKLETAIKAGKASGEARRKKANKKQRKDLDTKGVDDETNDRSTDVGQTLNENPQNVEPTNNHEPRTKNHEPKENNNNNSASDFSVIDSIADWIHPELTEINAMLMLGAPPVPAISQADYDHQLIKFKNYYAEKEIEGSYIRLEGRRKDLLTEWIKRDYTRQQKIKAQSQPARFNIDDEDWTKTNKPPVDDSYHPSHSKPTTQAKRDPKISVVVNGLWKEPLPNMSVQQTYDHISQQQMPGEMQDETYDRLLNQMQDAV